MYSEIAIDKGMICWILLNHPSLNMSFLNVFKTLYSIVNYFM
jgi:hypothetical protein